MSQLVTDPVCRRSGLVFALAALPVFLLARRLLLFLHASLMQRLPDEMSLTSTLISCWPCVVVVYFWGAFFARSLIRSQTNQEVVRAGGNVMFFSTMTFALGYFAFYHLWQGGMVAVVVTVIASTLSCLISVPFGVVAAFLILRRVSRGESEDGRPINRWEFDASRTFDLFFIVTSVMVTAATLYFALRS